MSGLFNPESGAVLTVEHRLTMFHGKVFNGKFPYKSSCLMTYETLNRRSVAK